MYHSFLPSLSLTLHYISLNLFCYFSDQLYVTGLFLILWGMHYASYYISRTNYFCNFLAWMPSRQTLLEFRVASISSRRFPSIKTRSVFSPCKICYWSSNPKRLAVIVVPAWRASLSVSPHSLTNRYSSWWNDTPVLSPGPAEPEHVWSVRTVHRSPN